MAYKVCTEVSNILKKYNESLLYQSQASSLNMSLYTYNIAMDDDGNVYIPYLRSDYGDVAKYDENCNLIDNKAYTFYASNIRGLALGKDGYFHILEGGSPAKVYRAPAHTIWYTYSGERISLTSGGAYYGLVFDNADKDIFYTYNYNGCKVEKWNWFTATKLGEVALPTALRPKETIAISGSNILMPTKNTAYGDATYYFISKDMSSYIGKTLRIGSEHYSKILGAVGSVKGATDEYFIFTLNRYDDEDEFIDRRLVKLSSTGTILANIVISSTEDCFSKPVLNVADLPTVIMKGVNWEGTYPIAKGDITNVGMSECYRRGFEWYEDGVPETVYDWYEDARNTSPARELWGTGEYTKTITEGISSGKKYWIRATAWNTLGKATSEYEKFPVPKPFNVKADNVAGHCYLYGNIPDVLGYKVVERGFEYLVQQEEPGKESTGKIVKETNENGFGDGEYHLSSWGTFRDLYCAPSGTMWYFRAYCKDDGNNKYPADSWMCCLPTITTQPATEIDYNKVDGNGYIIDKGASDLIVRGFEIKIEYSGTLEGSWKYKIAGFENPLFGFYVNQVPVKNADGLIIDFKWEANLIKTVLESYQIDIGAYMITIGEMVLGWPVMNNCLFEGDEYQYRAFADNEFGRAYGCQYDVYTADKEFVARRIPMHGNGVLTVDEEKSGYSCEAAWLDFKCLERGDSGYPSKSESADYFFTMDDRSYLVDNEPVIGPYTVIKNERIKNLPDGIYATRRGFRYGTTEYANDHDVHEDGQFTNGPFSAMLSDLEPETTYYIVAYIVVEGTVYEGEMEIITTEAERENDEFPTPYFGPKGQDYRKVEIKVKAEALASQGIIDYVGEKKSLPVNNHLIQTNTKAKTIANNYLMSFQLPHMKMVASYPNPLPIERRDEVQYSKSTVKFKDDGLGVIKFKDDGLGVYKYFRRLVMTVRKINSNLLLSENSLDFEASLELEE